MARSNADAGDDLSGPQKILRTVSPGPRGRPDAEMDVIGWSILLGLAILLVPMLPFLLVGYVILKIIAAMDRKRPGGPIGETDR